MTVAGLREATDADGPALVALVGAVFDEYPGCVLDLDDLDADLVAPRTTFAARGSRLWVVERSGRLVGCVGVGPVDTDGPLPGRTTELKRLYVAATARGQGLGTALVEHVHEVARVLGAEAIELWSDTRFAAGHRRYLAAGYEQRPVTRELHDPSATTEAAFWRRLDPTSATAAATWVTDDGTRDRTRLHEGDAAHRLVGTAVGRVRHDHEFVVDEHWRARRLVVQQDGVPVVRLAADGLGGWWRDGVRQPALDGCLDVALATTCAPLAATVRRLAAGDTATEAVVAVDPTTGEATVAPCSWRRRGPTTWHRTTPTGTTIVTTDDTGLPHTAGTTHRP